MTIKVQWNADDLKSWGFGGEDVILKHEARVLRQFLQGIRKRGVELWWAPNHQGQVTLTVAVGYDNRDYCGDPVLSLFFDEKDLAQQIEATAPSESCERAEHLAFVAQRLRALADRIENSGKRKTIRSARHHT